MLKIESCGEWPSLRLTKLSGFIIEVGLGEGWRRVGGGLGEGVGGGEAIKMCISAGLPFHYNSTVCGSGSKIHGGSGSCS